MKLFTTTFSIPSIHRLPILVPKMSRPYNKDKTNRSRQNNRNESPTVVLSKSLSWILRHGLDKSGLQARSDGYVRLDELVIPQDKTNNSSLIPNSATTQTARSVMSLPITIKNGLQLLRSLHPMDPAILSVRIRDIV
jgi:hypothetical protein